MRGLINWKRNWLYGALAVLFAIVPTGSISAEEDSETKDQYIIIELETVLQPELDLAGAELLLETDWPDQVLFSLQDNMESEEYSITGIRTNEPIIAQMLAQTVDYQEYDTIALYELISHQQVTDGLYDFNLQIPEDADITLYQSVDGQAQKSILDAAYTEEEHNRLPLISYQSDTNHWLVLYWGVNAGAFDFDAEEATDESAEESLEGKTESSQMVVKETEGTKAPESNQPEQTPVSSGATIPVTTTPTTSIPTTSHTHTWAPMTKVVHHEATYKDIWIQDSAAWDETVIIQEAWDENVLVQEAYDEQVMVSAAYDEPVYAWVGVCNGCGHKFLNRNESIGDHMEAGCWSSWHDEWMQVETTHHEAVYQTVHHEAVYQTVFHEAQTSLVHHDAVGHTETRVDQAAWDETITIGYTCSGCGATKEA